MSMEGSFEKINIIHNNTSSELENIFNQSSDKPISSALGLLKNEFNGYISILKVFFSDKTDTIKDIYENIKVDNDSYKINTFDLNLSMHMYNEYLTGLVEFIDTLIHMQFSGGYIDPENMIIKINAMIAKDNEFIDSIFGGEQNGITEINLNSAMSNIEVLIHLNSEIDELYTYANNFIQPLNIDNTGSKVVIEGTRLFFSSIRHYVYLCVKSIFDTFTKIEESMDGSKFESVEELFKLF